MPANHHIALPFILTLFLTLAFCHKRGQEYTYLSMFSRPQTPEMIGGENHLGQLYDQLSLHHKIPFVARAAVTSPPGNAEQSIGSNIDTAETISKSGDNSGDLFSDGDEEEEDEDEEKEESLLRESLQESNRKVRTKAVEPEKGDKKALEEDLSAALGNKYGEDLKRLQNMLHKIVVQYRIESLVDVPCRAHAHWMPFFLERLAEKKKNFRYYCVDTRKEVLKSMKETVGKIGNSKFVMRRFWSQGIPKADLVFSWAGLDNMKEENVKKYFTRLSRTKGNHKLIAIGSHMGSLKDKGSKSMIARFTAGGNPINVREYPFHLKKPMRIIGKLSTEGNDKQLYLYKAEGMM